MDDYSHDLRRFLDSSYRELRGLASDLLRQRPATSVSPTSIAHETWIRLARRRSTCYSRAHFLAIASRAVRDALVDRARRRGAQKRKAAGSATLLDEQITRGAEPPDEVLALHEALNELARSDPRKARIVELRFFGGLTVEEVARVLEVSTATVKRDWMVARAWLHRAVST